MSYRVLLVDDEPLARERVKRLLQAHEQFQCVGEAEHGDAALNWLNQHEADLVLLDIQMPGRNGLDIAADIQRRPAAPLVVFCTAYDEHALQAFSVKAIDYLLKPIHPDDLARALQRALEWLSQHRPANSPIAKQHIAARNHQGVQLIAIDDVRCCIADQKYVSVHHAQGETLVDESLSQLEEQFAGHFLRVHRSALVALQHIERLVVRNDGSHQVFVRGVEFGISISRRHVAQVKRLLKML